MIYKLKSVLAYWFSGVRIYIGIAAFVYSLAIWWWSSVTFGAGQLATIRSQEIFGWTSLGLLLISLLIGPLMKLFPHTPGKAIIYDARRATGISAAWFALLHATIVYVRQLNLVNPLTLPGSYQRSLLLGAAGLLILVVLALTSVNSLMRRWGVWWFRLHRLIYLALGLVIAHALLVGAHAASHIGIICLSCGVILWSGLHVLVGQRIKSRRRVLLAVGALLSGVVLLSSIIWAPAAWAHELERSNGVSGVLHIEPDDNPKSGRNTGLYIEFASDDPGFSVKNCGCQLQYGIDGQVAKTSALQAADSADTAEAHISFDKPGVYTLDVTGTSAAGHFGLDYAVRVTAGNASDDGGRASRGLFAAALGITSLIIIGVLAWLGIAAGSRYRRR